MFQVIPVLFKCLKAVVKSKKHFGKWNAFAQMQQRLIVQVSFQMVGGERLLDLRLLHQYFFSEYQHVHDFQFYMYGWVHCVLIEIMES